MAYEGPERRGGTEFCFSLSDPKYVQKIIQTTGFQFFSDPHWRAWLGHAKGDDNDRHFIPLRGHEPKDIQPSGYLEPWSPGAGLQKNAAGQVIGGTIYSHLAYDREREKYSRACFPDRRRG